MRTTVAEVMTRRVIALREDAEYKEIITALRHNRVSACPVIDSHRRVLGVVSEADLLCNVADPRLPGVDALGPDRADSELGKRTKAAALTAAELMTAPAVVIVPSEPVTAAAKLMQDRLVKRLPVVDGERRLVGIVSRSDVLSMYERSDADIWDDVVKVMVGEDFALDPAAFDITVRSGVVTVCGLIGWRETALRLLARIRHAEGVVAVRDRLSYPHAS
jgi:CBS-domain-containing membrane protein